MDEQDYKAINEELKPQLKQTAVEWLVEQLTSTTWKYVSFQERMQIFNKAKQMEKEQIEDAWLSAWNIIMKPTNNES